MVSHNIPLDRALYSRLCVSILSLFPFSSIAQGAYGVMPQPAPPAFHAPIPGPPQRAFPPPPPPPPSIRRPWRPHHRAPYPAYPPYPPNSPPVSGVYPPPPPPPPAYYPPPYYNNGGAVPYYPSPGTPYPSAPPSRSCIDGVCAGG